MTTKLHLIGANGATFDASRDVCFGKLYDSRSPTCKVCIFPVLVNGKVKLTNEVCGLYQKQGRLDSADITRLSSSEVDARLAAGRTPSDIVAEMIGDGGDSLFDAAWRVYAHRRFALRKQGRIIPDTSKREVRESLDVGGES